jgi:hypothetical protein
MPELQADLHRAGLQRIAEGGVFAKAMANFQLDAALDAGVINEEYMEGCFKLGARLPFLCSSLWAVCQ